MAPAVSGLHNGPKAIKLPVLSDRLAPFCKALTQAACDVYAERLVALAIFGSWARGRATPVSDIDVLVVARPLPPSRRKRVAEFAAVESATQAARARIWPEPASPRELSPVIKTPEEVQAGSPLFLDMTDACRLLWDRGGFLAQYLRGLRERMAALGTRRHFRKGGYFWEYKPGLRPTESVWL